MERLIRRWSELTKQTQQPGIDFSNREAVRRAVRVIMGWLERLDAFQGTSTFLDIGAGSGDVCRLVRDRVPEAAVTALTISEIEAVDLKRIGVSVLINDMHCLQVADDVFDLIWAGHVLEHSLSPLLALDEWKRVLKPEGVLVIWSPLGRDFKGVDDGTVVYGCKDHICTMTEWQYKWLFELAGLRLLHETRVHYQIENDQQLAVYRRRKAIAKALGRLGLMRTPERQVADSAVFWLTKADR